MNKTPEALRAALCCEKWPPRWDGLFPSVMAELTQNGCALADPGYYDRLHRAYGMLAKDLDLYKAAAAELKENEALTAFLALLCSAMEDERAFGAELRELSPPQPPEGAPSLAYRMLPGLALCSLADHCHDMLTRRGLPEDIIRGVLCDPEGGVSAYRKRNNGEPGFAYKLLPWYRRVIEGRLFRLGRLVFEMSAFTQDACVYQNGAGEEIALANQMRLHRSGFALGAKGYEEEDGAWTANITETDTQWVGHAYDANGLVRRKKTTLAKGEWRPVLLPGEPVLSLHIPAGGALTAEAADASLAQAETFFRSYFPEYEYKAYICGSWLLDPQLPALLGETSNAARFGGRFHRFSQPSRAEEVFYFVFQKPDMAFSLDSLPENTRMERAFKKHYQNGRAIYNFYGYFLR